jgi:fructose-specific phosphotransferase system IIC component
MLATMVLDAAAIPLSAAAPRMLAPVLLLALFLAGDVAESTSVGRLLPNFGAFALDASQAPPWTWLCLYAAAYCVVFLAAAYLLLTMRTPARTES